MARKKTTRRRRSKKTSGFPNITPSSFTGEFVVGGIGNGLLTAFVGGAVYRHTKNTMFSYAAQVGLTLGVPYMLNQNAKTRKYAAGAFWGGAAALGLRLFLDYFGNRRLKRLARRAHIYGIEGVAIRDLKGREAVGEPEGLKENVISTLLCGLGMAAPIPEGDDSQDYYDPDLLGDDDFDGLEDDDLEDDGLEDDDFEDLSATYPDVEDPEFLGDEEGEFDWEMEEVGVLAEA